MKNIIIIGGGAAGMMAGIMLAEKGYKPVILEKNDKLGRKLFITGKGRCNLTNNCDTEDLLKSVVTNSKFLPGMLVTCETSDFILLKSSMLVLPLVSQIKPFSKRICLASSNLILS